MEFAAFWRSVDFELTLTKMTINPYTSPGPPVKHAWQNDDRNASLVTAGVSFLALLLVAMPGLLSAAFVSMVHPSLEGAERSQAIARNLLADGASHLGLLGYLVILLVLLVASVVFFVGCFVREWAIDGSWRIAAVGGVVLAMAMYGYIVICSWGWVDSWLLR